MGNGTSTGDFVSLRERPKTPSQKREGPLSKNEQMILDSGGSRFSLHILNWFLLKLLPLANNHGRLPYGTVKME
jgi:hypothetical protein